MIVADDVGERGETGQRVGCEAARHDGGLDAPARLAEPVEDTLFFAGEATHDRLSGTVAGAMASGYRAAEDVLRARRRAS